MRMVLSFFAGMFLLLSVAPASAGDNNSIWFRQESSLARVGFDGTACGKFPMPNVWVDGENSCAKVPLTYLHKKTDMDGNKTKEVLKLEDTHSEECTRSVDSAGNPVEVCTLDVVSGRSVDGNFGRRQTFSILGAFGEGDSSSGVDRTFSTGLAGARRSTGD